MKEFDIINKNDNILISVVVPAYNAQKYIEKCIKSLKEQDFAQSEFLIINDGSIDDTYKIMQQESSGDSRFRLINQENKGVSEARNRGIKESKGEYIMFVDSDDFLLCPNALSILYGLATKNKTDVIAFGSLHEGDGKEKYTNCVGQDAVFNVKNNVLDAACGTIFNREYRTSVWNKIYRRKTIVDNSIYFHSYSVVMSEDKVFNDNVFCCSNTIMIIKDILYHYSIIEGSLSHSKRYENIINRNTETVKAAIKFLGRFSKNEQRIIYSYIICECMSSVAGLMERHNHISWKKTIKESISYIASLTNETRRFFMGNKYSYLRITNNKLKNIYYNAMMYGIVNDRKKVTAIVAATYHLFK